MAAGAVELHSLPLRGGCTHERSLHSNVVVHRNGIVAPRIDDFQRPHWRLLGLAVLGQGIGPSERELEWQPGSACERMARDVEDQHDFIACRQVVDRDIEAATRRSDIMRDLWTDIGYAVRKLRSAPAFTTAAIITLALGVGATTVDITASDWRVIKEGAIPASAIADTLNGA